MGVSRPFSGLRTTLVAVVALVGAPVAVTLLTTVPSGAVSTFSVTTNADNGIGSLRQAFLDANTANDDTVINMNAGLSVTITGAELTFDPANSAATLTINGNGSAVTRTALTDRIFDDEASGLFTINALTIAGGDVLSSSAEGGSIFAQNSLVINNSSVTGTADASGPAGGSAEGGAVWTDNTATITNSTIRGTADAHGTAAGAGGGSAEGGAVWTDEGATISNSSLIGTADAHDTLAAGGSAEGGALWSDQPVVATSSFFSGAALATGNNGGSAEGGGIWADEPVTLTDSMVDDSEADASGTNGFAEGGGVWTDEGATLVRSTVSNSTAQGNGTGAGSEGGGIWAFEAVSLTNSTVAANNSAGTVTSVGGGIFENANDVSLVYSDVVGNTAAVGANIAGPESGAQSNPPHPAQSGVVHSFASVVVQPLGGGTNCDGFIDFDSTGFNFSDDTTCGFTESTDNQQVGNNALLGALAANGGLPKTLLPQAGSPLINAIPNASCESGVAAGITTDERGLPRPEQTGGLCDIGAVEVQLPPPPPPPPPTPSPLVAIQPRFTG